MKLNRAWFLHAFFSIVEHGSIRALDALISIVLIQSLGPAHFGMFSVYQSWIAIALLFLPNIELSLFREYGWLKSSGELSKRLMVFRFYNYIKILLAALISMVMATLDTRDEFLNRFLLIFFAFALPLSHSVFGYMRDPLRFEMKQNVVAGIGAMQRLVFVIVMGALGYYYHDNVSVIVLGSSVVYVLFYLIWKSVSMKFEKTDMGVIYFTESVSKQLSGTTLWIHINGIIFSVVQTLDVLLLNKFGTAIEEIGRYSIALKTANFFQMVPIAIVSSFGVYLGINSSDTNNETKEKRAIWKMTAIFVVLCIGMFLLGLYFGMDLIGIIGRGKFSSDDLMRSYNYFIYLLAGVLILCCTHPISTYLGARADLKKISTTVLMPWLLISALIYYIAAESGRTIDVALMNISVYGLLFGLFLLFYFQNLRGKARK